MRIKYFLNTGEHTYNCFLPLFLFFKSKRSTKVTLKMICTMVKAFYIKSLRNATSKGCFKRITKKRVLKYSQMEISTKGSISMINSMGKGIFGMVICSIMRIIIMKLIRQLIIGGQTHHTVNQAKKNKQLIRIKGSFMKGNVMGLGKKIISEVRITLESLGTVRDMGRENCPSQMVAIMKGIL